MDVSEERLLHLRGNRPSPSGYKHNTERKNALDG
jgi:hypothetical protein